MKVYSYIIPESDCFYTEIPIYNEEEKIISIIKKNSPRILTNILHMLLEVGMPYCYKVISVDKNTIYEVDCILTGVRYTLTHKHLDKVLIKQERAQLIEKIQSFIINGNIYQFEKDYTWSGTLRFNGEKIAFIKNLDHTNINLNKRIRIEAINDDIASLTAVLYQTFIHEK